MTVSNTDKLAVFSPPPDLPPCSMQQCTRLWYHSWKHLCMVSAEIANCNYRNSALLVSACLLHTPSILPGVFGKTRYYTASIRSMSSANDRNSDSTGSIRNTEAQNTANTGRGVCAVSNPDILENSGSIISSVHSPDILIL